MVLILMLAVTCLFMSLTAITITEHAKYSRPTSAIIAIFGLVPLVYIIAISMHWLIIRKMASQRFCCMVRKLLPIKILVRQRNLEESLPDRLAKPGECTALLQHPMAVDCNNEATRRVTSN